MRTLKWNHRLLLILGLVVSAGSILLANFLPRAQAADTAITKAIAVLSPTEGNTAQGIVTFTQVKEGVRVQAEIKGLKPGQAHGFHVHQFGDRSSKDGKSAGGHFNPLGAAHAGPHNAKRHVGDLGNIEADAQGVGHYDRVDSQLSLDMTSKTCIIGRGLVVHGGTDDMKSQPSGAAGPRIAVAVIGIAKTP